MATLKEDLSKLGFVLIETHISWVFVRGDRVFKVKKPVDFGFLDFSTLDKRRAACDAELRLNGRLAAGVYRDVVPVTKNGEGEHALRGSGKVVDWAVEMERLSDSERADLLLEQGNLDGDAIDRLAERIAAFHAEMPTDANISAFGSCETILANVTENFDQTRGTIEEHLTVAEAREIETKQTAFIENHRDLLGRRMEHGRVRDGHGDLRLEHIYLTTQGPKIIDCIEFSDRLRYADVCADVAFLVMDLERLVRVDLAERFLAAYARSSGDYELYRLVDFYQGYRAYVRGKVASMLAGDAGASEMVRERARAEARRYFLLALSAGRKSWLAPVVIAVGGLIGSGKSTVSDAISAIMSAPIVDADRTRKSMLGVSPTEPLHDSVWAGAYTPEVTERTYSEVLERAAHVLASGRPVVLDASFRSRELRAAARLLAQKSGVPFFFVETRAPDDVCRERIQQRTKGTSISDGRLEIYDEFVARWEPVDELEPSRHLVVDTTLALEENVRQLREALPSWPSGLNA